jgi:hypothetical protein
MDNIIDTPGEIVRMFMSALETSEWENASQYMADHFLMSGWTPRALNKNDFLAIIKGLKEGIPGLIFNLHNVQEDDGVVNGTIKMTGYQSDSFILPPLGLPPIPQMAASINMPTEDVTYTLEQQQITTMAVHAGPDGGIRGLLRQLGVEMPPIVQ